MKKVGFVGWSAVSPVGANLVWVSPMVEVAGGDFQNG